MRINLAIKISILSILAILIIGGGYITYRKLIYDKKVFETDLRAFIPLSSKSVLQINKEKDTKRLMPYLTNLPKPYSELMHTSLFNYPLYFLNDELGLLMLAKQTNSQKDDIQNILRTVIFPGFAPKEKEYKGALIQFYTSADQNFFCCMFYKGIFAASYNYKLLENIVDTHGESDFFKPFAEIENYEKIKPVYCANLYQKDSSKISAFNINIDSIGLKLEGYTFESETYKNNKSSSFGNIDFDIFPNKVSDYKITINNSLIDTSMSSLFQEPAYLFYDNTGSPIYALKHKVDRFKIYDMLNELEVKNVGRKFHTKDFAFAGQRIYTASSKLSQNIFKSKPTIYLTFYKGYLIYSDNREGLIYYLKNNSSYLPLPTEKNMLDINLISFTKKSSASDYMKGMEGFLFSDSIKTIYVKESKEDSVSRKIEVIINN